MNRYQWSEETAPRSKKTVLQTHHMDHQTKVQMRKNAAYQPFRSAVVLRRILIVRISMEVNDRGKNPKHSNRLYAKQIAQKVDHPFDAFVGNQK
jgi:hypothetical protein